MVPEVLVAVAAALVAVAVFVVGTRLRPKSWQQTEEHAAGELVLDLVKNFFVAVVAFVVVLCWQQYDNAQTHTIAEAKGLVDTYWAAHGMPAPDHQRIQGLVREYTEEVTGPEWAAMHHDGRLSEAAQEKLDALRDAVQGMQPVDPDVADLRTKALDSLDDVAAARSDREVDVRRSVPGFLGIALLFGTVLLLLSPVYSGVRVTVSSVLMVALLGLVVGSILLQIRNLDRPFSGATVVPRDAYDLAVSRYGHID
ncbi:hypothetical protein BJY24_000571 [Nocardia transvalensis]|uniref:DUF4239 domain-containing protein n=1 Tax=Nocardia transvalensis TaxID=37333 RepID=A0A7W9UFZ2_9NOCA|nr:DUF4239 domain-containing protein [Nocardia transvalensis]MBB5911704.1 hypothetical protein [Nocardia transvalensis]